MDRYQRGSRTLAFTVAVVKKFSDDQAGRLAALIAYYGFFSLFPLLLLLVTALGFFLQGHPHLQGRILDSELGQLPVIGPQLHFHALNGNAFALVVGIAGSLLAGLGVTQATQNAFDDVWAVPRKHRPNFLASRLRGISLLISLGLLSLVSTTISQVAGVQGSGAITAVGATIASFALNLALFFAAFRLLTAAEVKTHELLPGVVIAALAWTVLQDVGGYLVGHKLKGAGGTYGGFAVVIGLMSWLYLGAQITLYAAEVNVVKARRLWPRGLLEPRADADHRTLHRLAKVEERVEDENVEVSFAKQTPSR